MATALEKLKAGIQKAAPGSRFQMDWFLVQEISEADAQCLADNAAFEAGDEARKVRGRPSRCHANAISVAMKNPGWEWWFGLALSDDGCWRVHSWAKNTRGRIIETTAPRLSYFGVPARTLPSIIAKTRR